MNGKDFSLLPFPEPGTQHGLVITGSIARHANRISAKFTLQGSVSDIVIPEALAAPARKNSLWQETCFELFIIKKNAAGYWEFNFSPSGDWNVYRFKSYRQGMEEEPAFTSLPFQVTRLSGIILLSLEFDLGRIVSAGYPVNIGISTVIMQRDGTVSYWALTHPGPRADFHRQDSFTIEL